MSGETSSYEWLTEAIDRKRIVELRCEFALTRERLLAQRVMIDCALPQAEEAIAVADAALLAPTEETPASDREAR